MAKYTLSQIVQHNFFLDHAARNDVNQLTRLLVSTDVVTGRRSATLFTDDGNGNGEPLFHFLILNPDPLSEEGNFIV